MNVLKVIGLWLLWVAAAYVGLYALEKYNAMRHGELIRESVACVETGALEGRKMAAIHGLGWEAQAAIAAVAQEQCMRGLR